MKKFLLFAAMFAVGISSYAQTFVDFNDAFPTGWVVNRDLKLSKYDNPISGAVDTGMVTAPINIGPTPRIGLHLWTTGPAAYTLSSTSINVSFDAFAFKGNTRNFSKPDQERFFRCNTEVAAFLVPDTYTSDAIPTGSNLLGSSDFESLTPGGNTLTIKVTSEFVSGSNYRVFFAGRVAGDCGAPQSQAYVVDNVLIGESFFSQNFDGTGSTGIDLSGGLAIGRYNTEEAGCGNDMGLVTPAITVTSGSRFITAPVTVPTTGVKTLNFNFDLYAFNASANFECAAQQSSLSCTTRLKIYIVDAANTSTGDVPTGTIYGQSETEVIGIGANNLSIDIATTLTPGTLYKLYVVSTTTNCSGNAQRYVLDNIVLMNEFEEEDFDDVFPTGWDFERDLKIAQYCNRDSENDIDVGLATPPIQTNVNNSYLMASAPENYAGAGSITFSFDLYAFKNDTRGFECFDLQATLRCKTDVQIFLVAASYNSTSVPTGSAILGQSEWTTLSLDGRVNVSIDVLGSLASGSHKLLVFGRTSDCPNFGGQQYIIDDIRITPIDEVILPVTFTQFNAKRNKSKVELTWETASEENNRGFHVQRNIDGTWKNIGFVFSQAERGNSTSALSYSFNDANSSRGISQYRLLQVDHDNKGKFSEVRSVRGEDQLSKIMVYPNPSNTGNINVMFDDASSLRDVFVTDVAGRVVKQYRNVNTNLLTIENLVDGYYTIQITNRTTAATTVEKVIIKKR